MQTRAEEISSVIKKKIGDYERRVEVAETGMVLSAGDGIARVYGLRSVAQLQRDTVRAALQAAEEALRHNLTEADHQRLFAQSVRELEASGGARSHGGGDTMRRAAGGAA